MTPHEMATICRFSRNGSVPWQQVADILGRNRDSLRAEYDSLSMVPVTLTPDNIGPIETLPEPECYRSTRARSSLRFDLLAQLSRRSSTVAVMSGATSRTEATVRDALNQMRKDGLTDSDDMGRFCQPATWSLTDFGREVYDRERQEKAA